jgi:energy-coupling factor transporter ATP-binding protein EcfA2
MPLTEIILTTITEKVFSYALDQGQSIVEDWVRKKLNLDPKQQAFKQALNKAYKKFEKKYPQWAADLFNSSFLENEGAPILAQFLIRDGHPDPSKLATRWAASLSIRNPERRTTLVRELEPAVTDFLDYLASELKKEPELSDLNDSRTFEQLASDLKAIRSKLGAEQATPGTRRDYLHWLIERNLYLDPRGTFQTQRQVQVKLDEVYISLRAQRDKAPSEVDRRLLDQEMAKLELKIVRGNLPTEEIEDQKEHVMARIESRFLDAKNVPGEIVELADAVKHHERLIILGDPGSGKSTLLRYLALIHAQALHDGRSEAGSDLGSARFPILIRIADYAEHGMPKGESLSQYLADYYEMHECPKLGLADLLATELTSGNCLVLLDGLDEIVKADDRRKVVERIEDFIRYHENRPNRFVITSRIAGYRSAPLGDPFVQYTVQEMDDTQIHRFLERWCKAVEAAQTPELSQEARDVVAKREIYGIMKAVQSSPGVHRLAANPLLLRTLALIHRTGAQLPQKRIELYKLAADTLARTWRTAQGVPETALVDDKYLTRLLGRLAYWLHENKSTGIATEQEVYRELGQEWARIKGLDWDEDNPDIENEVKTFLQAVREHTGLFVERAPKRYGFMHLTFEEYYAARHLVARSRDRTSLIREHLHKPRWEEPILLALGFVGLDSPEDAADLLETAILAEGEEAKKLMFTPGQGEELLGRDFLFALRCLGDNITARPKVLQKLVNRLADELLYQKGSATFSRYQQALNEKLEYLKGSEGALALMPYIIDALHNDAATVRSNAAQSLGQFAQSSPEALSALITALQDTVAGVRSNVAQSLGQLAQPSPEVIDVLLETLQRVKDRSVGPKSASLLGQIGQSDEQTLQALWHGLVDEDYNVRSACAQALVQLGRRFPNDSQAIERKLIQAIEDPAFDKPDSMLKRSGHDYAYDGLWLLVVGGELEVD